jgi:glucose-6-phosphate isomerase
MSDHILQIQRLKCASKIKHASTTVPQSNYYHIRHRKKMSQSTDDMANQQSQQYKCTHIFDQTLMKRATHMVYVGIGGSLNGPKAVYGFCLPLLNSKKKIDFVSNDGQSFDDVMTRVDPNRVCFVFVSKSGNTHEVLYLYKKIKAYCVRIGVDFERRSIVITSKNSQLDTAFSCPERTLYLDNQLVGRYTTISEISMCIMVFMSSNNIFSEILNGALTMDRRCQLPYDNNPVAQLSNDYAALLKQNEMNALYVINYCSQLDQWGVSYQQIGMETNGKSSSESIGPIIVVGNGSDFEHSILQLMLASRKTSCVEVFLPMTWDSEIKRTHAHAFLARLQSNPFASSTVIRLDTTKSETIGALFSFIEHRVLYLSNGLSCNPWDQPEVDAFKKMIPSLTQ